MIIAIDTYFFFLIFFVDITWSLLWRG